MLGRGLYSELGRSHDTCDQVDLPVPSTPPHLGDCFLRHLLQIWPPDSALCFSVSSERGPQTPCCFLSMEVLFLPLKVNANPRSLPPIESHELKLARSDPGAFSSCTCFAGPLLSRAAQLHGTLLQQQVCFTVGLGGMILGPFALLSLCEANFRCNHVQTITSNFQGKPPAGTFPNVAFSGSRFAAFAGHPTHVMAKAGVAHLLWPTSFAKRARKNPKQPLSHVKLTQVRPC